MKTLILAAALFAAAPAFSASCKNAGLPNLANLNYHMARAKMIEAGFFPILTPTDPNLSPVANEPRKLYGYGEVTDCSGTGHGGCWYKFISKKMTFTVEIYALENYGKIHEITCSSL